MFRKIGRMIGQRAVKGTLIRDIVWIVYKIIEIIFKIVLLIIKLPFFVLAKIGDAIDIPLKKLAWKVLLKNTPIENKVLILTFQGNYTCNPKWIVEQLVKEKFDYPIVWTLKKKIPASDYPLDLQFVQYGTYEFYRQIATAKIIIENTHVMEQLGLYKKEGQYVFQTWHGSMGIKRLDGAVVMDRKWKQKAKLCKRNVDFCLSNSTFETDVFQESYWNGVNVLPVGHARNDLFFVEDEKKINEIKRKAYRYLGLDEDKKIFLFAPTHRDNVDENYEELNYLLIKQALEERFGGDWQIVVRLHNRLKGKSRQWLRFLPDYVSDATFYEDMQELLLCTEAGLTDYSSWIFDYILLRKPGFIIELGFDDFKEQRGFYYPIESTPFPIAKDSEELAKQILEFDDEKYQEGVKEFLGARGCIEDGHASERIVAKINELMRA